MRAAAGAVGARVGASEGCPPRSRAPTARAAAAAPLQEWVRVEAEVAAAAGWEKEGEWAVHECGLQQEEGPLWGLPPEAHALLWAVGKVPGLAKREVAWLTAGTGWAPQPRVQEVDRLRGA